jgi:hypothetical protein
VIKKSNGADFGQAASPMIRERARDSQSRITNIQKDDDQVVSNMKAYVRQKTLGWKQTNHDTTRWPFRRSPTNKSRNGDIDRKSSSKNNFQIKPVTNMIKGK